MKDGNAVEVRENGNAVEVKDTFESISIDWKWPCFEEWYSSMGRKMERREKDETIQQRVPFKVIYSVDVNSLYKTFVEFDSSLIDTLREIIPDKGIPHGKESKVNAQYLYHYMQEIRDAALDEVPNSVKQICLNRLIKFLEMEYEETTKNRDDVLRTREISFDMLWAFYIPKAKVFYKCETSGDTLCGTISSTSEMYDMGIGTKYLNICIDVIDYDGVAFKRCSVTRRIACFNEKTPFSKLSVIPLGFSNFDEQSQEYIIENGENFFKIASKKKFMRYKGPLLFRKKPERDGIRPKLESVYADGRVMIDLESFAIMNPEYAMGNALPPKKCDIGLLKEKGDYFEKDEANQDDYILAPAVVFGFSFALKKWGQFVVSKLSEISFEKKAIDYLVISPNKMVILKGLVKQYCKPGETTNDNGLDPISNKGNGCIFLCYGPPGTGKTLTAECVAEFLERPLWRISAHELGSGPEVLERNLVKVLDIAYRWEAVLLIDEADIYLEKRDTNDLNRNVIVGIFLRLLEYYQGILFLTTNRYVNFDDAVCSRINQFIHYPPLGKDERRKVWTNFFERANLSLKASDDIIEHELNGREIRNVLHNARMLAHSREEELTTGLVIDSIKEYKFDLANMKKNVGTVEPKKLWGFRLKIFLK